jgi:hypothetical protein
MSKTETERAIELAYELIEIMKERGEAYGSNEHKTAQIMLILYPEGINNCTFEDLVRQKFITYIIDKLSRYVKGGHEDSLLDMAGYALRLAAFNQWQGEQDGKEVHTRQS